MKHTRFCLLLLALLCSSLTIAAESIDRIVAVVDKGVILQSEFDQQVQIMRGRLAEQQQTVPENILQQRVLDRMIINKLQLQIAERSNVDIPESMLQDSLQKLADRNKLTLDEFRATLTQSGMDLETFKAGLREELIINRIQSSYVHNEVKVSDNEIDHFLDTQGQIGGNSSAEYHIGHILIATPNTATPDQVQAAQLKAEKAIEDLQQGKPFKSLALSISDGGKALEGGDLGWFKLEQVPTLFVSEVSDMQAGDVRGPIRSPSGFHLVKLFETRGIEKHVMTQTHVQHILIKINALISDQIARERLLQLKERLEGGEDFETLARAHSEDRGSAIKGGDLGWVVPGALVPPFEAAMDKLQPGQISNPVQTQFGWHLIQVLDRQQRDNTLDFRKSQARQAIFRRKADEAIQLWLARLRDEAYVEIRLPK